MNRRGGALRPALCRLRRSRTVVGLIPYPPTSALTLSPSMIAVRTITMRDQHPGRRGGQRHEASHVN